MKLQRVDSVMPLCELFVEINFSLHSRDFSHVRLHLYGFQFNREIPFVNPKKVRTFVTDLENKIV